MRFIF